MRKICRTILAAGLMACIMMPAVNVMATDNIVGNWQADEAGVGFAKISASLVGLDGLCININEDDTADIIFAVDGDETKTVKNVKIEKKKEKNISTSRFQMPIRHRSRKARKSSLRLLRNSGWKDLGIL